MHFDNNGRLFIPQKNIPRRPINLATRGGEGGQEKKSGVSARAFIYPDPEDPKKKQLQKQKSRNLQQPKTAKHDKKRTTTMGVLF